MNGILIGNLCSLCATLTDSVSGTRKTKNAMLLMQIVSQVFYTTASLALRAYSATVQNVVAMVRNLIAIKGKSSRATEVALVILPVVLGIWFNNRGLIGLLPVIANLEYSLAVFRLSDRPLKLKYAFIINNLLFCVFNFAVMNFVGGISMIVVSVTTVISILQERKSADGQKS